MAIITQPTGKRRFGRFGARHEALARLGQRVALRRAGKQHRTKALFQPRDAATRRCRIKPEARRGPRQAFGARDGQKHAQIVPVHPASPRSDLAFLQNDFGNLPLFPTFLQG
jgi:hypothetical protein